MRLVLFFATANSPAALFLRQVPLEDIANKPWFLQERDGTFTNSRKRSKDSVRGEEPRTVAAEIQCDSPCMSHVARRHVDDVLNDRADASTFDVAPNRRIVFPEAFLPHDAKQVVMRIILHAALRSNWPSRSIVRRMT